MSRYLDASGSILGIAGAFLVAANVGLVFWGYVLFSLSAAILTVLYKKRSLTYSMYMQGVFFAINILGMVRWYTV